MPILLFFFAHYFFLKNFYCEIEIYRKLQKWYREVYPVSPQNYILHNIQLRKLTLTPFVGISLCHFTARVDLCNYHSSQDKELFYHHKDLSPATPFIPTHPLPPSLKHWQSLICFLSP